MTHKLSTIPGPGTKDMNTKGKKYPPKKSKPTGIDPASPQKNFVKASFDNKGDGDGFFEYMYGGSSYYGGEPIKKKASGYGHSIGQRAGKLRTSGDPRAHRIGKRSA